MGAQCNEMGLAPVVNIYQEQIMSIIKIQPLRTHNDCGMKKAQKNLIRVLLLGATLIVAATCLSAQDTVTPGNNDSIRSIPESAPAASSKVASEDYIISPDDELDIFVLDVEELSRTYRVSPTGMIAVPLLTKPIKAAGKSPSQLSQVIADQLREAGMVSHPQVTIQVKQSRLHSIAIAGSVKKPQ